MSDFTHLFGDSDQPTYSFTYEDVCEFAAMIRVFEIMAGLMTGHIDCYLFDDENTTSLLQTEEGLLTIVGCIEEVTKMVLASPLEDEILAGKCVEVSSDCNGLHLELVSAVPDTPGELIAGWGDPTLT